MPLKIIVAQRGWVFIGRRSVDGDEVTLTDAKCIRRWGTTKGLGQLALEGPQENTKLDPAGTVRLHRLGIVASFDCAEEPWAGK